MKFIKYLFCSVLFSLVAPGWASAQSLSCEPIDVKVELVESTPSGNMNGIRVVAGATISDKLRISIIGPNGFFKKDTSEFEFSSLAKGEYVVIVTGKKEEDNYCPTHQKIIIE